MDEHKKFLADRILSEERPITYRVLSRALDVNVNTAKEMLYDFYTYQNKLRADSVHATYLVHGVKDAALQPDVDVDMGSSQPEPLTDNVPTMTMTLVADDKLKGTLAQYSKVTAIHIYSLAPNPQKDFILLADVSKSISEYSTNEDAATLSKKYGAIYNPHTRRRDRKKGIPTPAPKPAAVNNPEPAAKPVAKSAAAPTPVKKEPAPSAPVKQETPSSSVSKGAPAPKKALGGIMQSFAKAASKPPKPKPAVKKEEDTAMALSDDGEADADDMPVPQKTAAETESLRQAKRKREDDLRRMMEEDDEEEEEDEDKEPEDAEMEEPEPEPEPEPMKEEKKEPEEVVSTSSNGRRRGKRRVMKKKRILDDQGYMVTIQEAAWESFSEDDTPAPAKKETPSSTPASSGAKSKKAPAAKGSQGSIMSFFAKK
ncbi:DNA polymerase subunit Cdc27 [Cordyceps fumosorosea ARSEF 2679]|uniref:DNA polymerase delta subunit 3 n=1 Tax=Cordyceps fumosorosea (strain ARSEF 2679) TaxID=1081104 RepID=A0A167VRS5_CORFA|nr:DNA polymerase subunit Cdc27 [Cordyceps fumosorosea ARSEF 2679]OAA62915.1 DNA polymerase subunit Cdc27 [Cordyceps fumosorosea ARSEF 2679]